MAFYMSEKNVREAINYFQKSIIPKDDTLGIFLMLKHLHISTNREVLLNPEFKDSLDSFNMLAKITDQSEYYERGSYYFPFMFTNDDSKKITSNLYQKGTSFDKVFGRIRDTITKKNSKIALYNTRITSEGTYISLPSTYQNTLTTYYLKNEKISLKHLAAWLYRFTKFDFDDQPTPATFTRVVRRMIIKYFGISHKDLDWFFEDDMQLSLLQASSKPVTGSFIREQLLLSDTDMELLPGQRIEKLSTTDAPTSQVVTTSDLKEYMELNGDNPSTQTIFNTLLSKKQIIITGVPGIGKSRYTKQLADNIVQPGFFKDTRTVQFHANFSYDEFIGGTQLENQEGSSEMKVIQRKGVLLKIIEEAIKPENKDNNYLLVIDEINRGNIAGILGETILALDRNYTVKLAKPIGDITELNLPPNLYIVGTMNTSDRNIAFLDMAIRRRFAFIELNPNYDFLSESVKLSVRNEQNQEIFFNMGGILKTINDRIYGLTKDKNKLLGQSYFIPQNDSFAWDIKQFQNQFNFVLLPALEEYEFQKNGITQAILGDKLSSRILDESEFYDAFIDQFSELVL